MAPSILCRSLILLLIAALPLTTLKAANESYIQSLSGNIKKGDTCIVIDDKFQQLSLTEWNQIRHLSVENIITFELRTDTTFFYQAKPFTCTANITIKYFTSRDQTTPQEIDNIDLKVKYDTARGSIYPLQSNYKFKNAFKVIVIVNSISSPEWGKKLPPIFRLSNQILVERKYPFDKSKSPSIVSGSANDLFPFRNAVEVIDPGSMDAPDPVNVPFLPGSFGPSADESYPPSIPEILTAAPEALPGPPLVSNQYSISWQPVTGNEAYDVEWTYVDALSAHGVAILTNSAWFDGTNLLSIPAATEAQWMQNDNTRVTVAGTTYTIDLPYMDGFILYRVRGVHIDPTSTLRMTTDWNYSVTRNAAQYTAGAYISAHQPGLNWQYTSTFAEEGKRKEIIAYSDATLRSRQTVTINNNDLDHASVRNIAVAAETIYDNMGRPTMNILPAPLTSTLLQYYPALNQNLSGTPYSRDDITGLTLNADKSCNIVASPMSTASGASRYYSPQNLFLPNTVDYFYAKYLPDASKYPFAIAEYTPDNTGRIRRQGGVGTALQIGSGKDTRYYYGKPSGPRDLERLFGMEAGDFSHYEKNLVVDPNGQVSVSYINATGKTVATALAGAAPTNTDPLSSSTTAITNFTQNLIQPTDFVVNAGGLYKSSSTTFTAVLPGTFTLHFSLSPAQAVPPSPAGAATFCSNCYYDITIDVLDNCGNPVAKDYPATPPFPGSDITCHTNQPPYTGDLSIPIAQIGEYTVIYTLKLSDAQINYQTDYYINNNSSLQTIQNYFETDLLKTDLSGCYNDCSTCLIELGSLSDFTAKMQALLVQQKAEKYPALPESSFNPNSTAIVNWITTTYNSLLANCQAIQTNCSLGSACEQKKEMMKNDVLPGGQYATYDAAALQANAAQVFLDRAINVVLLHYPSMPSTYLDDNGNLASGLSEANFIRAYQNHPEWADYFVPFHIEYCSYLWCKDQSNTTPATNMEVSYTFDQNLRQVITSATQAGTLGYYDHSNIQALLAKDPFFSTTGRGYGYRSQMISDLGSYTAAINLYVKDLSNNPLPGKDIISYGDWLLYCNPGVGATSAAYVSSWQSCSPAASCRSANREWQMYRDNYLQLKGKYVQLAKQAYNPSCRNCFVGDDGLTGDVTSVTLIGSPTNPAFTFDGMASYVAASGNPSSADLMATAWTCNAFSVPLCNFRTLFKYDLSGIGIPAGSTITSAVLNLYANTNSTNAYVGQPTYGTANAAYLRRVTSAWAAATTGWGNQPTLSTADQKVLPQSTNTAQNYSIDITDYVNQWVAAPASNYGVMLALQNETYYNCLIFGGPGAPAAIQPRLVITWSNPTLGVSNPLSGNLANCNNSQGGAPPACPAYTEFSTMTTNYPSQPTTKTLDCSTWDYNQVLVHNAGPVGRDVTVRVTETFTITNGETGTLVSQYTNSQDVTMKEGTNQALIGLFTHAQPSPGANPATECNNYNVSFAIASVAPVCPLPITSVPTSCTSDPNYPLYKSKIRIFNESVNSSCLSQQANPYAPDNAATGHSNASLANLQAAAISQLGNLQTGWFSRLQAVRDEEFTGNAALSDAVLTNLTTALYNFGVYCIQYISDEKNIRPVSSLPTGVSAPSTGYTNFKSIFTAIIGNTLMQQGFSQDLLDKPYPYANSAGNPNPNYDVDPQVGETSPAICSNITSFYTTYVSSGASSTMTFGQYLATQLGNDYNLTDIQLTDLQNKCAATCLHGYLNDGLAIPVGLAADPSVHPVLTCSLMSSLSASFATAYPGITFTTRPKLFKLLFTNYVNATTAYSLSYYEYVDYQTACTTNSTTLLYDKPGSPQAPPDYFACTAGLIKSVFTMAGIEYEQYISLIRKQFRNSYVSNCLANQAGATMTSQNQEYQYTLYYYDQAGTLVKTVPSEGVRLLTDAQITQMEQLAAQAAPACGALPANALTDAPTILSTLSARLQDNTAQAMEIWFNDASGTSNRELRWFTPDNKYMYQVAIANNRLWIQLCTLTSAGGSAYTISLKNTVVADLTGQPALQSWTHLFVQSPTGLAAGAMQPYLDGNKLTVIPGGPAYPFAWVLNPTTGLPPQVINNLKQLRLYAGVATDAQVLADYQNSCMIPVGSLASGYLLWGLFNSPTVCTGTTASRTVTGPDKGSLLVTANPDPTSAHTYILNSIVNTFTVEGWVNPQAAETFYAGESTDIYAGTKFHNYVIHPQYGGDATTGLAGMGVAVGTNGVVVIEHAGNYAPALLIWQGAITGWTHIAIVYNNKVPSLYINGVFVTTGTASTKTSISPSYNIGGGGYGFFTGGIDEIRIWSLARSSTQLTAYYNKSVGLDQPGIAGYWKMDATGGNTVIHDINCLGHDVVLTLSAESWQSAAAPLTETSFVEAASRIIVPNHGLLTTYAYNSLNQVVQQAVPDAGSTQFWYDRLGRITVSQNAEQLSPSNGSDPVNRYGYTLYDALGRIIEVGEKYGLATNAPTMNELLARTPVSLTSWLALGANRNVTVTAYDSKPVWSPITVPQANLRKRVAASTLLSLIANPGLPTDPSLNRLSASYYNYDMAGNVQTLTQENSLLIADEQKIIATPNTLTGYKTIQYDYDLISGKVNKVMYQPGKWDQFNYQYVYDADNRLLQAYTRREASTFDQTTANLWTQEANYTYYPHGPLARTQLGNQVQGLDYAYTLQGWLKGVNGNFLNASTDMSQDGLAPGSGNFGNFGRDAYAFSLNYFQGDYTPIGAAAGANAFTLQYQPLTTPSSGRNLFNGNIGSATYALSKVESAATIGYTYRYDQLNRLTAMDRHTIAQGATIWNNTSIVQDYGETISYDGNGNIKTYNRNGNTANGLPMDMLTYGYNLDASGNLVNNKLRSAKDAVTNSSTAYNDIKNGQVDDNYTYDHIGNLIGDQAEGNLQIQWTLYGKIRSITKPGIRTITYDYDASGDRINKTVLELSTNPTTTTITHYVRDAQGLVLGVYTYKFTGAATQPSEGDWTEQHLYGGNRLGILNPNVKILATARLNTDDYASNSTIGPIQGLVGLRSYELTNHLGNVLSTISDKKIAIPLSGNPTVTDHYEADVQTQQDYYPFGMEMPGRGFIASGNSYRYGFSGKEKDSEIKGEGNSYDFGERIFDPRIGRWLSVDPLFREYPHQSTYVSMSNDPMNRIDPNGMGDYYGKDGSHLGSDGKTVSVGKGKKAKQVADDKAYTTSQSVIDQYTQGGKTDWDKVIANSGTSELSVSNSTLGKFAYTIARESSGNMEESYGLGSAMVNLANYKGKDILATLKSQRIFGYNGKTNFKNTEYSMASAINALTGGTDYSNGAIRWDGFDLAARGFLHPKALNEGGIEISEADFNSFKAAWPDAAIKEFSAGKYTSFATNFSSGIHLDTEGDNAGRCLFKSTAVHGRTLFWGVNKDPIIIKTTPWRFPMALPSTYPAFNPFNFGQTATPAAIKEEIHVNAGYKNWKRI